MKISQEKKDKICEQILVILYGSNPKTLFTSEIAKEIARDEEFIKHLLVDLQNKKLVENINKNSKGIHYIRRRKWKLTDKAYLMYKNHQNI